MMPGETLLSLRLTTHVLGGLIKKVVTVIVDR